MDESTGYSKRHVNRLLKRFYEGNVSFQNTSTSAVDCDNLPTSSPSTEDNSPPLAVEEEDDFSYLYLEDMSDHESDEESMEVDELLPEAEPVIIK